MNSKSDPFHLRRWDFGLKLSFKTSFQNRAAASATLWQHRLQRLVDHFRNRTTTGSTVPAARLSSWSLRLGFGIVARKGSGLSFTGSLRFFQKMPQTLILCLLFDDDPLELRYLFFKSLNFLPWPFHASD